MGEQRSGFAALRGSTFALMLAFAISQILFGHSLEDASVAVSFIGLVVDFGVSFGLTTSAMLRLKACKRAKPWTPPSERRHSHVDQDRSTFIAHSDHRSGEVGKVQEGSAKPVFARAHAIRGYGSFPKTIEG
ncbi:hypothetical protein [Brevundimonas sp. LM2]|uniref:hypothetical protein n=1 Tax=Brevundimonas sp. LM2 TaxID=1938605 RepID=UPI0012378B80|nr:hypothetical protein [Brevundimonas sp. LM2]